MKFITIETTCENLASAKKIAKLLLEEKLAACIQFQKIESMYLWQNQIENKEETLVSIKTNDNLYNQIETLIKKHHEYDVPQIIAKEIILGSKEYLDWIKKQLK